MYLKKLHITNVDAVFVSILRSLYSTISNCCCTYRNLVSLRVKYESDENREVTFFEKLTIHTHSSSSVPQKV